MKWTSLVLFLSVATGGYAKSNQSKNKLEKLIEDYDLQPLAESEFWKKNPGVLPYEECKLMKSDGSRIAGLRINLGVGLIQHEDRFSIFCFSTYEKTAFQIPIQIDKDSLLGFGLSVSLFNLSTGHVRKLHSKLLADIFGTYKGFGGGFGIGTSASGAVMFHDGIMLTLNESLGFTPFEIGMGFREIHVGTRSLVEDEILSMYFLEKQAKLIKEAQDYAKSLNPSDERLHDLENTRQNQFNMSESSKYTSTWKYWIHHLQDNLDAPSTCHHQGQTRAACETHLVKYAKLWGDLDYDFLSSLRFVKINSDGTRGNE